jgi:AraC family transcriptional regulator of adaptative response/methylated-DNA-[protein]-cysteine methyltransferase
VNLPDRVAVRVAFARCTLGVVLVAATRSGVCAVLFGEECEALMRDLRHRYPEERPAPWECAERSALIDPFPADDGFGSWVSRVIALIETPTRRLDIPLDPRATPFQRRVWQALLDVPCGTTVTYTDLANRIGSPAGARAVARACAANPIAVAIPCHRVIRSDGSLGGYRWGIERKQALLERERNRTVARRPGCHYAVNPSAEYL